MTADEIFRMRLTSIEADRLAVRAAAAGMTRSEFARSVTAAEVIPVRIFNRRADHILAHQLARIDSRLDGLEAAANAYLTERGAAVFIARLDQIRTQIAQLADAGRHQR